MRLDNKFQYNFEIDDDIDADELKLPTMLLQPIIENAILHGLRYKEGADTLGLKFSLLDITKLVITITDKGIGRKKSAETNSKRKKSHNSKATGIINERISIINSTENQRIQIKYIDLLAGDKALGTSVELSLYLEINR
jgi:two-component system LytT family sensor kinase